MDRQFRLGTALVSLVEPHPGHAAAYHRWYERDHFYSGVMAGPGAFSGRRWVAPRWLKELPGARGEGSYLATYWIEDRRHDEFSSWAVAALGELRAAGRMFEERELLDTAFCRLDGWAARDGDAAVPPELALDHGFPGLVVTRGGPAPPAPGGSVALVLTLAPLDDGAPFHLSFLDADPREAWATTTDAATADWAAAFVPTVPGTDRYTDEL